MKVLVGCEYSGTVRDAFISRGHYAMSCDLLPTDKPGPHFQGDVFEAIDMDDWDLAIFHPPCTYLCNSGAHWLHRDPTRREKVEIIGRRQNQSIQPYEYGHPESKRTCLWLEGLPLLTPTNTLQKPESGKWENQTASGQNKLGPSPDRWKIRSTTYQGIANAMADQWGGGGATDKWTLF